jgi:hypothetical protein
MDNRDPANVAQGSSFKPCGLSIDCLVVRNRQHYKTAIYFHCGGLDLYPRVEAPA